MESHRIRGIFYIFVHICCLLNVNYDPISENLYTKDDLVTGNVNALVDKVLRQVPKEYIDPIPIEFKSERIQIEAGKIHGLSKIRRSGNCTLTATDKGTKINLQLEVSNIYANFKYKIYAGFMWIKGDMQSKIEYLEVKPEVHLEDGKLLLDSLSIAKLERTSIIKLTGISPLFNWLLRIIMNEILYIVRPEIKKALEKEAKEKVQLILNNIIQSKL